MIFLSLFYVFQFVILGTFGETHLTDIAVDAVCVMACKGEKLTREIQNTDVLCQQWFYEEPYIFHL